MVRRGVDARMSRSVMRGFRPQKLQELRAGRGLSPAELGRVSGLGRGTVAQWEIGRTSPTVDALARVAAQLDVSIGELVSVPVEERTLVDWRILVGLTQPQLAQRMGISTAALSSVERGDVRLTPERALLLAEHLGISTIDVRKAYSRARSRPAGSPP